MCDSNAAPEDGPVGTVADTHVGARIRERRIARDWDAGKLAAKVGIDPCRLADIEAGLVRASAAELYRLGEVLGATISYFFEGIGAA